MIDIGGSMRGILGRAADALLATVAPRTVAAAEVDWEQRFCYCVDTIYYYQMCVKNTGSCNGCQVHPGRVCRKGEPVG
jgi:hypothetical protein